MAQKIVQKMVQKMVQEIVQSIFYPMPYNEGLPTNVWIDFY